MPQLFFGRLLIASAILGLLGLGGVVALMPPSVDMRMKPATGTYVVGEELQTDIVVESDIPVNVFKGNMSFDPQTLEVVRIDYNTSIADLWAEKPWFENGDGTLNFIGGTTKTGGFTGIGELITITFRTKKIGDVNIVFDEVRILQHDGLGTDASIQKPIDGLFMVTDEELEQKTVLEKSALGPEVHIVPKPPTTDLNGDGKQSIADVSIFMLDLVTQDVRSDFNQDGKVTQVDLSILMSAK